MSSEYARAIIKHYQPAILAGRAQQIVQQEWDKGCTPSLAPVPVHLEPPYEPLGGSHTPNHPSSSDQGPPT